MFWFISFILALFLTFSHSWRGHEPDAGNAATVAAQQQASQTIIYLNALNDYLHDHPQADGTIDDSLLGVTVPPSCHHIIQASRVYVYQPDKSGLMYHLRADSDDSALLGRVVNGRLQDNLGVDMGVAVPSVIGTGDVVYLN